MIRTVIMGRLGNQMFQYAHAYNYAKMHDDELHLYFYKVNNQLDQFNATDYVEEKKLKAPFFQKACLQAFLIVRRILCKKNKTKERKFDLKHAKWLARRGIILNTIGYSKELETKKKNILLFGYFESERYFEENKAIIKKKYSNYNKPLGKSAKKMLSDIEKTNSVAVHIRRGDFVGLNHVVCDKTYFEKCIEYMKKHVKNPKFFVFSDDIEWVKENISFPDDTVYELPDLKLGEIMYLRSKCKHFICANSTFSWWGAYLGSYDKKIVLAPKYWRPDNEKVDLVLDGWIKIDNR